MSSKPCPIGALPEAFDGKADSAIAFWNVLENYYTANDKLFTNDTMKIQAALTHFKLGTQAGKWASDRMSEALNRNPVDYGTWAVFKKDFETQFIPLQTKVDAIAKIHPLRMGSREFNDWFQEWSIHTCQANVDKSTKMFAFC